MLFLNQQIRTVRQKVQCGGRMYVMVDVQSSTVYIYEDLDIGTDIASSDRLKLLANPFGTKINTSSNKIL